MTKVSWALLCLLLCFSTRVVSQCTADTTFSDVIFLIDNSGSIDDSEYLQFEQTIKTTANKVKAKCPVANIGVMHYGGRFGRSTSIEYPLISTNSFDVIQRQFCATQTAGVCVDGGGGDDMNSAIGQLIDSINSGRFMRNTSNSLSLVIFTDAFTGFSCDVFPACSQIVPYTNIDRLKAAPYNAKVTVVGVTQQAASNLLAVYASPGGTFNSPLDTDCSSTFDGCALPRKYIPIDFNSPSGPVSDSIAGCVDCSIIVAQPATVSAGADQTICNDGETAVTLSARATGTPPFTFTWDNGLGNGAVKLVSPRQTTTYRVSIEDSNGCIATDSVIISTRVCDDCDAFAGNPLDHQELCLINNRVTIPTSNNRGVVRPSGFDITYVLTDANLTVLDYRTRPGSFVVRSAGIYRVHTLIAETSNRQSPDYIDLSIIKKGQSNLFVIVNCLKDHDVCADFDFAGRVHVVKGPQDMMCMPVENTLALCTDGIDNDRDGLVDCRDGDCEKVTACLESSLVACNDLIDNDNDGLTDCYDPDCWRFKRCYEKEEKCNDGIDNDGDGLIDCADESCKNAAVCQENSPTSCVDGLDNDGDGLTDCADPKCIRFIVCAEYDVTKCADGIDNDYDGLVDCADPDCQKLMAGNCATAESTLALCSDGIDNDGDGLTDCADPDCGYTKLRSLLPNISNYLRTLDPTCPNNDNGAVALIGDLADGNFQYRMDNGPLQASPIFENLSSGRHEIQVYTLTQCALTFDVTLSRAECIEICNDGKDNDGDGQIDCADADCGVTSFTSRIDVQKPTCPDEDNGSITINKGSSAIAYKFSIDGGRTYSTRTTYTGLTSGTYHVIAITSDGCLATAFVTIDAVDCTERCSDGIDNDGDGLTDCADPDCGITGLADDITITNASCPFNNNGTIQIGGQLEGVIYQYSIDGGEEYESNSMFENLVSGTYSVVIRTSDGCMYRQNVVIIGEDCTERCSDGVDNDGDGLTDCADPDCGLTEISDNITVIKPTCPTEDNGSITIGGQLSDIVYEYSIDGGRRYSQTAVYDNLSAGEYAISVRANSECTLDTVIVIDAIDCSEKCSDGIDNDGDGLTDCEDPDCGTTGFADDIIISHPRCPNNDNGSITIGGQLEGITYEYSLDGGETYRSESSYSGMRDGMYLLKIRTADLCTYEQVVMLLPADCSEICNDGIDNDGDGLTDCEDPDCGLVTLQDSITFSNPTCPTLANGVIEVRGQASNINYSYSINGAAFRSEGRFENLTPGAYTIDVRTESGCESRFTVELSGDDCTEICSDGVDNDGDGLVDCADPHCGITGFTDDIIVSDKNCATEELGSIRIRGQYEPVTYSYSINGGANFQSSPDFVGLNEGQYVVVIRTDDGCDYTQEVTINGSDCQRLCRLNLSAPITMDATCPALDNGTAFYSGGAMDWVYSVGDGDYQESFYFQELDTGLHMMYVKDVSGCVDSVSFRINGETCSVTSQTIGGNTVSHIDVKVILQGAYDSDEEYMKTTLNELGYLPGQRPSTFFGISTKAGQPYNTAPWYYSGSEGSEMTGYDESVVDWVLVSVRTGITRESTIWTGAGLLHSDGRIEMLSDITLNINGDYYVVVEHRNHLPVMSATPIAIMNGRLVYDFTNQDSYKSVIGMGQKKMNNGKYAMIAGNGEIVAELSSELDINARDFNSWLHHNGTNSSYYQQDYDMNGDVNIKDRILWEANNGNFSTVPHRR